MRVTGDGESDYSRGEAAGVYREYAWLTSKRRLNGLRWQRAFLIAIIAVLIGTACSTFTLIVLVRMPWPVWSQVLFIGLLISATLMWSLRWSLMRSERDRKAFLNHLLFSYAAGETVPNIAFMEADTVATPRRGKPRHGSLEAATGATTFLLLGLGVVWFAKQVAGVTNGAVLSAFVIVPALLYVVLRGDLTELKGPGGWAATFRVTKTTVSFGAQKLDTTENLQLLAKGSVSDLDEQIEALDRDQPVLMTISLGQRDYTVDALRTYVEKLIHLPRFRLIAFLDRSGLFVGCASPGGFLALMQNGQLARSFLHAVTRHDVAAVSRYPGLLKYVIKTDATNAEGLEAMGRYGLDALAVVDADGHVKGVAEREQLMTKLILSLCEDATRGQQLRAHLAGPERVVQIH